VVCQLLRAGACGAYHIASANLRLTADIPFRAHDLKAPHEVYREGENVFKEVEGAILSRVHGRDRQGGANEGLR
jgi:hypothetical protein